ncbi:MAG TPA: alpha amylase C-terminal domain-containing protein [Verrucomicrobiae bacterium]|jgi:1,4-alpha-glucan branching enzyme|nr:alpha amylase C-terminal domain-containing protein [Verrucomicrobiae bacterium]
MSNSHVQPSTPMGAELTDGGATFRAWAPGAKELYVVLHDFDVGSPNGWRKNGQDLLVKDEQGYWSGFFSGVCPGQRYRFWVVGGGGEGFKRDPYARELEMHGYPNCNCIVCDPNDFPWHDQDFRPPPFNDLVVYQFHIGVFFAEDEHGKDIRAGRVAKFLDAVNRIEYLVDLGVNAIMPLPFVEFQGENSLGYNGTDLFSPEMDYAVDAGELGPYLSNINRLLAQKNRPPLIAAQLTGQISQLKTLIDLCHLYGIAVIADVVYNHAGGNFDDQSIHFFDRPASSDNRDSIYFLPDGHAGGLVFAFWKREVRQFLIDNAKMFLEEYHIDGFRYDQVTVIDEHGGWFFCQDLSSTLRFIKPTAIQIAEYWGNERWRGVASPPDGMGFDAGYGDGLRGAIRRVIAEAAGGTSAMVNLDRVKDALYTPYGFGAGWRVFQCVENHDLVDADHTGDDRQPRIAALGDSTDARSWYARSRARVATGLLLTAPGIPMIFMGQEFLEDKPWSDNPHAANLLIWWAGLEGIDRHMADHHRFTRDLFWLRRKHPALRGEGLNVFHVHNDNRVIAFQRWLPGVGRDIVVVASLNERTFYDYSYRLGFPGAGHWHEVFNSDIYDYFFNPISQGNPGGVTADGPGMHGLPNSAGITLPANSLLVFARDLGDG